MPDDLPGWPTGCSGLLRDPHEVGTARSACALLTKGGSWRSYAYTVAHQDSDVLRSQLLVSQGGQVTMRSAEHDPQFTVAECRLRITKKHELEIVKDATSWQESFLTVPLGDHQHLDSFRLVEVKGGVRFETETENDQLLTSKGDIELTFMVDGDMCRLLLHKETSAEITAREAGFSKDARDAAQRAADEEAAKAATKQARRDREAAIASGAIQKKRRKRKADKW